MPKRSSLASSTTTTSSNTSVPSDGPPANTSHPSTPLPKTFTDNLPLPKVLVFDLDYTLWPFWCDTHCTPPFKPLSGAEAGRAVTDRHNDRFGFYAEVPSVLAAARTLNVKIAAASRTHAPDVADKLLRMLTVREAEHGEARPAKEYFDDRQIYPGDKIRHMEGIKKSLGVDFSEMLFFDDEERNRNVERERGVCFYLVRDGVSRAEIDRGVEKWRKARGKLA